jgi:hypothetical protein
MKEPKRVRKAIMTLDKMIDYLHYYMGDCPEFKHMVRVELQDVEDLLRELSVERKVENARLAKKLKAYWESLENSEKGDN